MKLPDIEYNSGNVRPLAKEETSLPMKAAQVEIDLSKARLGAELNTADAIGQANIRLAREMRDVDRQAAYDQAKIAIDAYTHRKEMKAMSRNANIQLINTLTQTAISTASQWYEASEEAKATAGASKYSTGMAALTAKLENSSTIDLNAYPDVDFSGIPKEMIYEGTDEVTGQPVRTAPNHLAAPLVYASEEKKIYQAAAQGVNSRLSQAKFNNAIAPDQERAMVTMIGSNAKHQKNFLAGQYEQAIETRVNSGDLAGAIDALNSAEARGVMSASEAGKRRQSIVGDTMYSRMLKAVDTARGMGDLQQVREAAYSLPKEYQTSVRAAINLKENEFEKIADRQRTQAEHAMLGLNKLHAAQVGLAEGGLQDYGAGANAIIKKFGGDPHLDDYLDEFKSTRNALIADENRQKERAVSDWYKDPAKPIPAWAAGGKELREMEKFQAQAKSGEPIMTNMETYNKLQRMAGEDPEGFKKLDINLMRPALSNEDMKHFSGIQSKLLEDNGKPVQIANANTVFDTAANQVWGKEGKRSKAAQAQADGAYRAYTVMVEQATAANNGKPLPSSELQRISDDVFRAKTQTTVEGGGWFGRTTQKAVTLADPDIAPYIPALTSILQGNRVTVTPDALIKEYQAWLKNGRLEELR